VNISEGMKKGVVYPEIISKIQNLLWFMVKKFFQD